MFESVFFQILATRQDALTQKVYQAHKRKHASKHTSIHIRTHTHTHASINTHPLIHTHTRTYTSTHTHAHNKVRVKKQLNYILIHRLNGQLCTSLKIYSI